MEKSEKLNHNSTILIVDDDPGIRRLIRISLEEKGYRTLEAEDGVAGIKMAEDHKPDIVILDIMMPKMDGMHSLKEIMGRNDDLEVIMCTAFASKENAILALNLGAFGYIEKPIDNNILWQTVLRAIDKLVLRRKLRDSREQISELAGHLINVRELEKSRLAKEIHDEFGQLLTAVSMNLYSLTQNKDFNDSTARQIKMLSKYVDRSFITLRNILKDLKPEVLNNLGLVEGIQSMVNDLSEASQIEFVYNHNCDSIKLAENIELAVYRTVQESLTNVLKHSGADKVTIDLNYYEKYLNVKVVDNGKGFQTEDLNKKNHYGILGMNERIKAFNGKFKIGDLNGSGASIEIEIPL